MPVPYEPIIRHTHGIGDVVCDACHGAIINHACGLEWCHCTCMETDTTAETLLAPQEEEFMPVKFPHTVETPTEGIMMIPDGTERELTLGPLMIPERVEAPVVRTDTTVFWLGLFMGLPIGIVGMADSINPWVRGILIALSVLTALAVAGRMAKED